MKIRSSLLGALLLGALVVTGPAQPASAAAPAQTAYAGDDNGTVTPIDTATNTAGSGFTLSGSVRGVAITPDGTTGYATDTTNGTVVPFDTATNTFGTPIPVGNGAWGVAITPDGSKAYVTNLWDNSVTPIDVATNTAGTPITVGAAPYSVAITPDGTTALVSTYDSGVAVIDTATDTTATPIAVSGGEAVLGVAITPDGSTAYAASYFEDHVHVLDLTSMSDTGTVSVHKAWYIEISPDGNWVYVGDYALGDVIPIDTATNTADTPITMGGTPSGIAFTADSSTAYVGISGGLRPIDVATQTHGTTISTGTLVWDVALTPVPSGPPVCTITGTNHNDRLVGTSGDDVICAGNGNDSLRGKGGEDTLLGESGNDKILPGGGDDIVDGGGGRNVVDYKDANSSVTADLDAGTATGGSGADSLTAISDLSGSVYSDVINDNSGDNRLVGREGKDDIDATSGGSDLLNGGYGADTLQSDDGVTDDTLMGGIGPDNAIDLCLADAGDAATGCEAP